MRFMKNFGWLELITGCLYIILGIFTFANPSFALSWIVFLFSIAAIVNGITDILFCLGHRHLGRITGVSMVSGVVGIIVGIVFLTNPDYGSTVFSAIFAVWFIAHSISRVANSGAIHIVAGRIVRLISIALNLLCMALGVLMLLNLSLLSITLGYLVAVALFFLGMDNILEAFYRVTQREEQ